MSFGNLSTIYESKTLSWEEDFLPLQKLPPESMKIATCQLLVRALYLGYKETVLCIIAALPLLINKFYQSPHTGQWIECKTFEEIGHPQVLPYSLISRISHSCTIHGWKDLSNTYDTIIQKVCCVWLKKNSLAARILHKKDDFCKLHELAELASKARPISTRRRKRRRKC